MTTRTDFKSNRSLMIQGTTSDAGKSIMVAAFCRILSRQGVSVAPFKPQNMALNSAVTEDGGEIGRAQAVQAEAAGIKPSVLMNPVLLKPNSNTGAQVIVLGQAVGNMEAWGYHDEKPNLLGTVVDAHEQLTEQYDAVIIEGAGSPAEINLRDNDIANMGFAEEADCPVAIVADIDRGGVFAHLYGTYELLSDSEKQRVVGFIINRFRGDVTLLQSGLDWLEEKTGVPVLGVIPYLMDLHIEAEDAVQFDQFIETQKVKVVVVGYPRMSNHTDFDALRIHPNIDCEYLRDAKKFSGADLIILPGSKHVRADLEWLKKEGWQSVIEKHLRYGGKVLGVCGGYQMLGDLVKDPLGIESDAGETTGLGLLPMHTTLASQKQLLNVTGSTLENDYLDFANSCSKVPAKVKGYEIHAGVSEGAALKRPVFQLTEEGSSKSKQDGAYSDDGQVLGTYVHGLFDESEFLNAILSWLGVDDVQAFDYEAFKLKEFDRLADAVEEAIGLEQIKRLVGF